VESVNSVRDLGVWAYLDTDMSMGTHKQTRQFLFWDLETDTHHTLHTSLANAFVGINSDHCVYLVQGRVDYYCKLQCCTVGFAEM